MPLRLREKDPADVHGKAQIRDSCYTSLLLLSHSLLLNRNERKKIKDPERVILTQCSTPQPSLC